MLTREQVAGVLAEHRQQHNPTTGASDCLCGEWTGPFTVVGTRPDGYPMHLADALLAHLARERVEEDLIEWREEVGRRCWCGSPAGFRADKGRIDCLADRMHDWRGKVKP